MTKKGHRFLWGKIGVTPSVAAQGDTNPTDATDDKWSLKLNFQQIYGYESADYEFKMLDDLMGGGT